MKTTNEITWTKLQRMISRECGIPIREKKKMLQVIRALLRQASESSNTLVTPASVKKILTRADPILWAKGAKARSNTRHWLRKALRQIGMFTLCGRDFSPLTPQWKDLLDHFEYNSSQVLAVSRLVRFLSRLGTSPDTVTSEHLSSYCKEAREDPFLLDATLRLRQTVRAWNWCSDNCRIWPRIRIPLNRVSEYKEIPPRFIQQSLDVLSSIPSFRLLKRSTFEQKLMLLRGAYRVASKLSINVKHVTDLLAPNTIRLIATEMRNQKGGPSNYNYSVVCLLSRISASIRNLTAKEDRELRHMRRFVRPKQYISEERTHKVLEINNEPSLAALLCVPYVLVSEVDFSIRPLASAKLLEAAAALEIILLVPMRIGQLARLELGKNLATSHSISDVSVKLHLQEPCGDSTIELPLPSARLILLYIYCGRPLLMKRRQSASNLMFPGKQRKCLSLQSLRVGMDRHALRVAGVSAKPDYLRWLAVAHYCGERPARKGDVPAVIGGRRSRIDRCRSFGADGFNSGIALESVLDIGT